LFASVVKSRNDTRAARGRAILERLKVRSLEYISIFRVCLFETELLP